MAFVLTLCFAEQQPIRGRFRNKRVLSALLGRRARWISFLVQQKDLVELTNGELYFDGWDEWQEGDWKVAERMKRVRERKRSGEAVTPSVTVGAPVDVTPPTVTPLSEPLAVGGRRKASDVTVRPVDKSTPSDAISNGQPDDPVVQLAVGMHELLGHPLSGQDALVCQAALNQFAYMTTPDMLRRAAEHIAHCQAQDPKLPTPRTVAGFSETWRKQNDWLADHGTPKAYRPGKREPGMARLADTLATVAPQKDPDE